MKIVVTGALGHIGSLLIRALPDCYSEAEIILIDNLSTLRFCSLFELPTHGRYRFVEADVAKADLSSSIKGARAVIHLAAITDAAGSFEFKERLEQNNYNATLRTAEACALNQVPFFYVSTTSVYGTQNSVVDENCSDSELQPQSPYAETKLREEKLLQKMGEEQGLNFVICRFGTIFGTSPGMRFHTAVNKFCWQAVMGHPITVWKTALHQVRPYLALSDAVQAIRFVLDRSLFDGEIYNVLTLNATVAQIIEAIKQHIPTLSVEYVDTRIMNQLSYEVSREKFLSKGFSFHGKLEQGVGETVRLLKNANGFAPSKEKF